MGWNIHNADKFYDSYNTAPLKVRKKLRQVFAALRDSPISGPNIKAIESAELIWRYRVDNWRYVYHCNKKSRSVLMLSVRKKGKDKKTYRDLGVSADGTLTAEVIADESMHGFFEITPTAQEQIEAANSAAREDDGPIGATRSEQLPHELTADYLSELNIPEEFHHPFIGVTTAEKLLEAAIDHDIPDEIYDKINAGLYPPSIKEIINGPKRELNESDFTEEGDLQPKKIEEFMLALDEEQKPFVKRFQGVEPTGPWMVKGGPGSGKSTVALHCIRELLVGRESLLELEERPLRILFTTFTKSLVTASRQLLRSLGVDGHRFEIEAINIDALAKREAPDDGRRIVLAKNAEDLVKDALRECHTEDPRFNFSIKDIDFLFDEIEWVIIGEGCNSEEAYLAADRSGRGRRLGPRQRAQLWRFSRSLEKRMRSARKMMLSERIREATTHATPQYDYVFIDEAQDLKPLAIRMCLELARDPKKVFLTADPNQTIYGANMPWKRVSEYLDFRGNSSIFRRNYRTTREIRDAIQPIIEHIESTDRETFADEPVYNGVHPSLGSYTTPDDEATKIGSWLMDELKQRGLLPGCAAVLCPTNRDTTRIAQALPDILKAKAFSTKDLDLGHRGVKVMTMHAAKGLQFPLVAVTGLERGRMPWNPRGGMDESENEIKLRRTFFVACSRAMKNLLVLGSAQKPSPFLDSLDRDAWYELD